MKSVGILTFHASHNYGSMLQAYALQQAVSNMGYKCEIINFRSLRQKQMFRPDFCSGNIRERLKRFIVQFPHIREAFRKHKLFEAFLQENLRLSAQEYADIGELEQSNLQYDYYISGSDQIWNTDCFDFDIAYFLPFVNSGKRIAYAPSMGPNPESSRPLDIDISFYLKKYDRVSVREPRTAIFIQQKYHKEITTVIDPTLLIPSSFWESMIDPSPLIDGEYIFLYSPKFNSFENVYKLAEDISARYKIKVILSRNHKYLCDKRRWRKFDIKADIGPKEFLNLIKNARLVCCDSFHAVVFSILLQTPFLAMEGIRDSRISNLLQMSGLINRSVNESTAIDDSIFESIPYDHIERLQPYINNSLNYLCEALND